MGTFKVDTSKQALFKSDLARLLNVSTRTLMRWCERDGIETCGAGKRLPPKIVDQILKKYASIDNEHDKTDKE